MKRIVETISIGGKNLEYSVIGEGEPIMVMHGGHSNCNEEFGYKSLIEKGYSIITPSRAGYGKTAKDIGENLTVACDHYAKLLDYLQIDQIHLVAVSAGGPSGIRFAALYPDRVKSFTLQCAVSKEWLTRKDMEYKAAKVIFRPSTEKMTWNMLSFFNNLFPKFMFRQMVTQFSTLSYKKIKAMMVDSDIEEFKKMNNRQRSGYGFLIDLAQTKDITNDDLKSITCPTLIIHSKNDGFIPLEHPNNAHESIPNSKIYLIDSWGHLIWLGKDANKLNIILLDFLTDNSINTKLTQ